MLIENIAMKKNSLNLVSLEKVNLTLQDGITEFAKNKENLFVRDACIQRFEYTYELCSKMLRRYLTLTESNPSEVASMSFPHLIRTASSRGLLLNSWEQWAIYRDARNMTSHTYDEGKAKQVIAIIPNFLADANYLIIKLKEQLALL